MYELTYFHVNLDFFFFIDTNNDLLDTFAFQGSTIVQILLHLFPPILL